MITRSSVITRKSLVDFSSPILLAVFFVPYIAIAYFIGLGMEQGLVENFASQPLHIQEQQLLSSIASLTFIWGVGIPMMVLTAVLAATGIAKEAESGTLRILLSKPIRRWEVLIGKFVALFLFTLLAMIAGSLFAGSILVFIFRPNAAAISGSVGTLLPGTIAYATFVAFVIAVVGVSLAVLTRSRIKTVIAALLIPGLFLGFVLVRLLTPGTMYTDYYFYLFDVNYHFGNTYVFIQGLLGIEFSPATEASLATLTGVYDATGAGIDPLVGGMSGSVPLAVHVSPLVSTLIIFVFAVALLAGAIYQFERMDID